MSAQPIDYLAPDIPASLPWATTKLVRATNETLKGYGELVKDYNSYPIEIVQWPKPNGRPIDAGTGDQAGTKKGIFEFWREGDYFYGRNNAVHDEYLLGWSVNPGEARKDAIHESAPERILLWHANYHPDGGQLFFPLDNSPFVTPLALPGDDVTPDKFVTFYFDGTQGLYIHPGVWHEGIFPLVPAAKFYDAQGSIHARVSVNFPQEFNVFLDVPLRSI
ncbi:MAG: ureidoglycolate hydrolase [Bacteroidetes bacterium]|nr:ureidoglycolate hydrolase [Bacteroidota bacterium]